MFSEIEYLYSLGLFTKEDLQMFVDCNFITKEEMDKIIK